MAAFNLTVVTPTGAVIDSEIDEATLPGARGEFGVLPNHRPALMMLGGGSLRYIGPAGSGQVLIRGGVAEIRPDAILVLTDRAETPDEVDRVEAQAILDASNAVQEGGVILDDAAILHRASERGYAEAVLKL